MRSLSHASTVLSGSRGIRRSSTSVSVTAASTTSTASNDASVSMTSRKRHIHQGLTPSASKHQRILSHPHQFMSDDDIVEAAAAHTMAFLPAAIRPFRSLATPPRLVQADSIDRRPFVLPQPIWCMTPASASSSTLAASGTAAAQPPLPRNLLRYSHVATAMMNDHQIPMDIIQVTLSMVDAAEPMPIQVDLTHVHPDPADPSSAYQEFQCPRCEDRSKLYYVGSGQHGLVDDMGLNDHIKDHLMSHWVNEGVVIQCYSARGRRLQ